MLNQINTKKLPLHIRSRISSGGGATNITINGNGGANLAVFDITAKVLLCDVMQASDIQVTNQTIPLDTLCFVPSLNNTITDANGVEQTDYALLNQIYDNYSNTSEQKRLKIQLSNDIITNINYANQILFALQKYDANNAIIPNETKIYYLWLQPQPFGLDVANISQVLNEGLLFDVSIFNYLFDMNRNVQLELWQNGTFQYQNNDTNSSLVYSDTLSNNNLVLTCNINQKSITAGIDVLNPIYDFPALLKNIYNEQEKTLNYKWQFKLGIGACRFQTAQVVITLNSTLTYISLSGVQEGKLTDILPYKTFLCTFEHTTPKNIEIYSNNKIEIDFPESTLIIQNAQNYVNIDANQQVAIPGTNFSLPPETNVNIVCDLYLINPDGTLYTLTPDTFMIRFSQTLQDLIVKSQGEQNSGGILSWAFAEGVVSNLQGFQYGFFVLPDPNNFNSIYSIQHCRIHASIITQGLNLQAPIEDSLMIETNYNTLQIMPWTTSQISYF